MADFITYTNQGAIRNKPLSPRLVDALSFLPGMGLGVEVFSGGQDATGPRRTGSTRHDHGMAADVFFTRDGKRLDWRNPEDIPVLQSIVRSASERGLTGFGAGPNYMQPGSMHIGFGTPAVWGADGRGVNAPAWLREAASQTPQQAVAADAMAALGKAPKQQSRATPTLLGSEGNDNMAEQPQGLLGGTKLGEFLTPDRRDHLIAALEGMTLNPNQAIIQAAGGRIQQRQQDRAREQQSNRTAEWLRSRGRDDLAEGVAQGVIPANAAIQTALTPQQADNVVVSNRLVNRQTGEVVADFSVAEAAEDVPTAVRSLQIRAEAGGLKPGTPEYQEFMLRGGANKGIALQVGPDGTVSFAQGGAELKPLTEAQSKSATFAVRAEGALPILDQNDTALTSRAQRAAEIDPTGLARELQTPEFQAAKQAGDEFLQAILRKDTGAAITKQEQDLYGKTYLPQPGDSEEQILQKRQSRRRALEALKAGMSADAILAQERALERSGDTPQPPAVPAGTATHRFNPETGEIEEIK